jgi:ABC-type branched-subunit amino acid transport system permease subunit
MESVFSFLINIILTLLVVLLVAIATIDIVKRRLGKSVSAIRVSHAKSPLPEERIRSPQGNY